MPKISRVFGQGRDFLQTRAQDSTIAFLDELARRPEVGSKAALFESATKSFLKHLEHKDLESYEWVQPGWGEGKAGYKQVSVQLTPATAAAVLARIAPNGVRKVSTATFLHTCFLWLQSLNQRDRKALAKALETDVEIHVDPKMLPVTVSATIKVPQARRLLGLLGGNERCSATRLEGELNSAIREYGLDEADI